MSNRLSRTSILAAVSSATSAYDANDRLAGDVYDADGNTTSASGAAFAYDFENRIKSVNNGAVTILYDGDGNRVAKTAGGITTKYLVDDLNPTGFAQVIEEIVNGSAQRVYTYGNSLISQNQLIGGNWAASFYGYDGQGSVRFLTDANGAVTDRYDYDAFGNLISSSGSTPNNYLYGGQQFDGDLGSYYLRARYYSQQRGRFLSMDLILGETDEPITLHKYLYANADPVNLSDPSGLQVAAGYAVTTKERVLNPYVRAAITLATVAAICVLYGAASAIWPEGNSRIPFPFNNPLCTVSRTLTYYHYSTSGPSNFAGGLWPGSSATSVSGLDSYTASQGLGIPPPLYEYPVTVDPGVTPVIYMGDVPSSNRYPGGLPDYYFPQGSLPGSVGPPKPVPQTHP